MPAGKREPGEQLSQYARAVRTFDWQDFFDNWSGSQFFDWLRAQLTSVPDGYDVVLVDSRTGVTEMGGVCAYQLADVAVMLCAPNYQNLDGTFAVSRDFRSDAVLALRGGRPLELLVIPARLRIIRIATSSSRISNAPSPPTACPRRWPTPGSVTASLRCPMTLATR